MVVVSLLVIRNSVEVLRTVGADKVQEPAHIQTAFAQSQSDLSPPARFFFEPVLKSVSYHPVPLKRKPGMDSIFFNSGA